MCQRGTLTHARPSFYHSPPLHEQRSDRFHFCWCFIVGECRPPVFDDDPFYFDFSDEFLAEFGFGNFLPAEGLLFSFRSYNHEFDDASFTFSVESYVGVGNHHRPCRKKRRPNCQYRKKSSVKKSCWYREFLRPGMTRDLTHELSASDRFGEFRSYF